MALQKPENQPYAIIFRAPPPHKQKLSVCMENQLDIACVVHYMMNDTPSTGKLTLCCNISNSHQTNKQTSELFICMENNFEIVCGVRSIKNDTPSTGKLT